jgi:hypothetical protein
MKWLACDDQEMLVPKLFRLDGEEDVGDGAEAIRVRSRAVVQDGH